jgi:hypothetical protein
MFIAFIYDMLWEVCVASSHLFVSLKHIAQSKKTYELLIEVSIMDLSLIHTYALLRDRPQRIYHI